MSEKKRAFRLRLNLFDCIVLVCALGVGAFLVWNRYAPQQDGGAVAPTEQTVRYTVRIRAAVVGTSESIHPGDALVDAVRNYTLGNVVSATAGPARYSTLDEESLTMYMALIPDREDIELIIEASATENSAQILVGGGYDIRAGEQIFIKGPGYLGSGYVTGVERGEAA